MYLKHSHYWQQWNDTIKMFTKIALRHTVPYNICNAT